VKIRWRCDAELLKGFEDVPPRTNSTSPAA
jgi:hypothetical protein